MDETLVGSRLYDQVQPGLHELTFWPYGHLITWPLGHLVT